MLVISCRIAPIRCSCLQNECYPRYHTTHSVLSCISQHIWIKIGIVQGILIIVEKFRTRMSCMRIRKSAGQIDDFRRWRSWCVTGWGWWPAGQRWSRLWSPLSASGGWRCTWSIASPECLRTLSGAILARKAAGRLALRKHCWVSSYRSLDLFMPRKLNTPLLPFSDLSAWLLNEIFRFLYCIAREAFFGHFAHIQWQAHIGLFQLYSTSLPCDSCRHVENLQDISCCF